MAAENGVRLPNQADEREELLCTVPDQGQTPRRAPFMLLSQVRKAVIREMSVQNTCRNIRTHDGPVIRIQAWRHAVEVKNCRTLIR
jgi:hypothetical protein